MADFVEEALVYRRYAYRASILRYWEGEMIAKHLDRLVRQGLVERRDDGSYARDGRSG